MEWIEAKIKTKSEAVELITGLLMTKGIPNVRIIDDEEADRFLLDHSLNWDYKEKFANDIDGAEIIFYVQDDIIGLGILDRIAGSLSDLVSNIPEVDFGDLALTHGHVNDDDWLHEWKKTYKPFTIGRGVVVRPFWEEYNAKPGEVIFTIDPGAVFGTGLHATTQLCIMALEDIQLIGKTVLDIGCGSGILSVIALLLGAAEATACDIDPGAARSAKENAGRNNIEETRYKVQTGELHDLIEKKYDILLANIVADVIIDIMPSIRKFMKEDGLIIVSGIIDERVKEVRDKFKEYGFEIKEERDMDDWFSLVAGIAGADQHA